MMEDLDPLLTLEEALLTLKDNKESPIFKLEHPQTQELNLISLKKHNVTING